MHPFRALALAAFAALTCAACLPCQSDSDCASGDQCVSGACVPLPPRDTTPPSIGLLGLAEGATVHGVVPLTAQATDDTGVAEVAFAVDGQQIAVVQAAPYAATWTSTAFANGAHTLTATARDAAGNSTTTLPLGVTLRNGAGLSVHTSLGLPGPATGDAADTGRYLSLKPQYAVSYNGALREPNWVAWELNAAWLGPAPRQNDFRADASFPASIPQAQLTDYAGSGLDRGHLCPSEDRGATVADNQSTFLLTNMVPQSDNANGGPWAQLEEYSRTLAKSGKELFIVAGGIHAAGEKTIGADRVAVPGSVFKVIAVLDAPGQGVASLTSGTRVISVVVPNDDALVAKSADWRSYRVTAAAIEAQTGLEFFADAAPDVRAALTRELDTAP